MSDTQTKAAKMAVKLVEKLSDIATGKPNKPAQPAAKPNIVIIDARSAGYDGEPARIMAVTDANSGMINIKVERAWREQPVPADNTIVVTDTPQVFNHWGLSFNEREQMQSVMASYKAVTAAGLLKLDDTLQRYNPAQVIQTRKIDDRGRALDFDSMGMNNGHIAVLLAVWAARMVYGGYAITKEPEEADNDDNDGDDDDMLPFSV